MTEDEIRKAAHWFAKNGDKVDIQHSFEKHKHRQVREGIDMADDKVRGAYYDKDSGDIVYWDGKEYVKISGGVPNTFCAPDYENAVQVLSNNGTYTATDDGYVQRRSKVTNPATPYAEFTTTINGQPAFDTQYTGLLSTGLYSYVAHPTPVKAGDVIVTTSNGSGIENTLWFMPIRE